MSTLKERKLKFETLQLHVGQEEADPVTDARAVPIYQTSSYVFHNSQHAADRFALKDAGNIYGRLTNPTEDVFEKRIASLEGGVAALAVGSGAAAVAYAIQNLAFAGDHVVAAKNIYGGTYNLLAHTFVSYGINTTFVKVSVFVITGLLVGVASFLQACKIGNITPASSGQSYEMYAIAAVVLGGISMSGGRGKLLGVLFGALSYTTINFIIVSIPSLSVDIQDTFQGLVLIIVILIQTAGPVIKESIQTAKRRRLAQSEE